MGRTVQKAARKGRAIATLNIRVRAGARREQIVGWMGDQLRVAVQAPPVEGAANRALIRFLARRFQISASRVKIVRGEKSKIKTVELLDVSSEGLQERLASWISGAGQECPIHQPSQGR